MRGRLKPFGPSEVEDRSRAKPRLAFGIWRGESSLRSNAVLDFARTERVGALGGFVGEGGR